MSGFFSGGVGGAGEANTISNASTDGAAVGIGKGKVGVDLQLNGIKSTDGNLSFVLNATTHTIEVTNNAAVPTDIPYDLFYFEALG